MNHPLEGDEFGFEANPTGPWQGLEDQRLKDSILTNAAKYFKLCTDTAIREKGFAAFVDLYTQSWLEFKAKVDAEAASHGFRACQDLSGVPEGDRPKVAILALTIHGSFLLLGNGCLTPSGGSEVYERIPYRQGDGVHNQRRPSGVSCTSEPCIGLPLSLTSLISKSSNIYLLYYTTDTLQHGDALHLEESIHDLSELLATRMRGVEETVQPDRAHPREPERRQAPPAPARPAPRREPARA